jgi:hypothetical protein
MSCFGITPPVGFCGELRMTSLVSGEIFASRSAGSKLKPRDSRRYSGTGTAPMARICDS